MKSEHSVCIHLPQSDAILHEPSSVPTLFLELYSNQKPVYKLGGRIYFGIHGQHRRIQFIKSSFFLFSSVVLYNLESLDHMTGTFRKK